MMPAYLATNTEANTVFSRGSSVIRHGKAIVGKPSDRTFFLIAARRMKVWSRRASWRFAGMESRTTSLRSAATAFSPSSRERLHPGSLDDEGDAQLLGDGGHRVEGVGGGRVEQGLLRLDRLGGRLEGVGRVAHDHDAGADVGCLLDPVRQLGGVRGLDGEHLHPQQLAYPLELLGLEGRPGSSAKVASSTVSSTSTATPGGCSKRFSCR